MLDNDVPNQVRQKINQHPLITNYNNTLKVTKNNFERFLWVLENFANEDLPKEFGKFTFHFQTDFPNNCLDPKSVTSFIDSPQKSLNDYETGAFPDGLLYLDLFSKDVFFEYRIFQKLKTLEYRGSIYLKSEEKKYEKNSWETFWLQFNIFQFQYEKISIIYK